MVSNQFRNVPFLTSIKMSPLFQCPVLKGFAKMAKLNVFRCIQISDRARQFQNAVVRSLVGG